MARFIALLALIVGAAAIKQTQVEDDGQQKQLALSQMQQKIQDREASEGKIKPIVWVVIGAAVFVAVVGVATRMYANRSGYKTFGDKSGLSTSSSDITSSETGSTDRELKSRMERFEKRLEDHKKMLETRDPEAGSSSITDSESKLSSSVGGGKPMWFNKK